MGSSVVVLPRISVLLLVVVLTSLSSCTTLVFGNEAHDILGWSLLSNSHHHPSAQSPEAQPPTHHHHHHHHHHHELMAHPPAKAQSPGSSTTTLPTRKLVAVQGVVYCKSCKYTGVDTLLGASPLLGAVVRLECNNTRSPQVTVTKTDKNGYFLLTPPKTLTTYGSHKCRVSLVSSPLDSCNKPTDLHAGLSGAILMPQYSSANHRLPSVPPYQLFSVGPFAFEPSPNAKCTTTTT